MNLKIEFDASNEEDRTLVGLIIDHFKTEQVVEVKTDPITNYTIDDIKEAATKAIKEGKRDQVKKILSEFEVGTVAALTQEDYGEFMKKVGKL